MEEEAIRGPRGIWAGGKFPRKKNHDVDVVDWLAGRIRRFFLEVALQDVTKVWFFFLFFFFSFYISIFCLLLF